MTDQEISRIVSKVLRDRVPSAGFSHADVRSETDFDGGSVIRVTAHYECRPLDRPDILVSAVHDIRAALIPLGEDRFVFLTNEVASEQELEIEVD